jgi:hypothetical protein
MPDPVGARSAIPEPAPSELPDLGHVVPPLECQTSANAPHRSTIRHANELREYVASRMESEIAERMANGESPVDIGGSIWVPQSAYGPSDAGILGARRLKPPMLAPMSMPGAWIP